VPGGIRDAFPAVYAAGRIAGVAPLRAGLVTDPVRSLLEAGLGGAVPPAFAELVPADLDLLGLQDFRASLVIPFDGGPVRLAVADTGYPRAWEATVRARWPDPGLAAFLGRFPGVRRMIDTDGSAVAEVFLDDLQVQGIAAGGAPLMCLTRAVPSGVEGEIVRLERPTLDGLAGEGRARLDTLVARGASGIWGARRVRGQVVGFVWVTESRWRRDPERTRAIVESLGAPPAWRRVVETADRLGVRVYPDAVDWKGGAFDVTVGVLV
jgi:hypothetical protein